MVVDNLHCTQDMRGTGELKMSQVLATAYGEVVKADGKVDEGQLTDLLKKMPVSIGAGKRTVCDGCSRSLSRILTLHHAVHKARF